MMEIVVTNIYIFVLAVVLALLEIQVEGQHGWAKNLPTWRPHAKNWYVQVYSKLMSGKELTGYHALMFSFVFLVFHLPYIFGLSLTFDHWIKTLSFYFMFIVIWDFLWYVLNPYYPLKHFKQEHIIWHSKWFLGLPVDYYWGIVVSLLVLLPQIVMGKDNALLGWWVANIILFGVELLLTILFTTHVLKIDNWDLADKSNKP